MRQNSTDSESEMELKLKVSLMLNWKIKERVNVWTELINPI